MKVGFTGTRHGMTPDQYGAVRRLLHRLAPSEAHHGDCRGADAEFDGLARNVRAAVQIHPGPDGDPWRAHCEQPGDIVHPAKNHLARNRDIVATCDALIATPKDMCEQPRGGTYYTIGYARKRGKRLLIAWPDGSVTEEPRG